MTATVTAPAVRPVAVPAGRRRRTRAAVVAGSVVAAGALFVAGRAAGADATLVAPGGKAHTFVLAEIGVAALVFGLLGWGALAVLERCTRHAVRIWSVLAAAVVALSIVPVFLESGNAPTRTLLIAIHVAVGLTLLPLLRTSPRR